MTGNPDLGILYGYKEMLGSMQAARKVYSAIYGVAHRSKRYIEKEWFVKQFIDRHRLVGIALLAEGLISQKV